MNVSLVSIIMPCYNDGKYILESIKSVLNQTYSNIELIIIDDGSEDKATLSILSKVEEKKDYRIQIFYKKHRGVSEARNYGIKQSQGKYILPLDADDLIKENYIEKAVNIMEKKEKIGIVYCYAELFGNESGKWLLPDYSIGKMLVDNVIFVTSLFRKVDWEHVGGFDCNLKYGIEDYDFWLSIIELGRDVYQIPEILFYYRKKNISRTSKFLSDKNNLKTTYEYISKKHTSLYRKYVQEFSIEIRNILIEKEYKINVMKKYSLAYRIIDHLPLLKKYIKIFFRNKYKIKY